MVLICIAFPNPVCEIKNTITMHVQQTKSHVLKVLECCCVCRVVLFGILTSFYIAAFIILRAVLGLGNIFPTSLVKQLEVVSQFAEM